MKRKWFSGHQVETYYIKMLEPVTKLTTVHIIQWIEHKMFEAELLEGKKETLKPNGFTFQVQSALKLHLQSVFL